MHEELRGRLKVVLTSRLLTLENECHRLHDELAILRDKCSLAGQQLAVRGEDAMIAQRLLPFFRRSVVHAIRERAAARQVAPVHLQIVEPGAAEPVLLKADVVRVGGHRQVTIAQIRLGKAAARERD